MSWEPVKTPIADLLTMHARVERLRLVEKIQAAELQLRAAGLDPAALMKVRRALLTQPVGNKQAIVTSTAGPPAPPPDTKKPLKHLKVQER